MSNVFVILFRFDVSGLDCMQCRPSVALKCIETSKYGKGGGGDDSKGL